MEKLIMTGKDLHFAVLAGSKEIIKNKNSLNKINVFPVADGDTGSNLASTANSIIEESIPHDSVIDTINSISDAALYGARGNSGIIFAQFLNGLSMESSAVNLNVKSFASLVERSVPHTYKAISNPKEGTILTVIKDWSNSLKKNSNIYGDFQQLLTKSLEEAKISLENTKYLLSELRNADVVDSGAKGFVHFLEGILNYYKYGKEDTVEPLLKSESIDEENHNHIISGDIKYRYCTEAYIKGENIDIEEIRGRINNLGDSLILAGNQRKVRIHIHTNDPTKVFSSVKDFGDINQQKVDDMVLEYNIAHHRISNTAILTDSIADIPQELLDKYQIHMLPVNLIIDGTSYLDKLTISPEEFYKLAKLAKMHPSSSQPSPKTIENMFSFLLSHYESIIVVTVSSKLSGTYSQIKTISEKLEYSNKKISVIDSKLDSGAQGLLVLKAAEELAKGNPYEEVLINIEDTIKKTKIFVNVDTLDYMVRGGRVSPLKGTLAKIANLKPIVSLDENGFGTAFGASFSRKGAMKKLIRLVDKINKEKGIIRYSLVHSNALGKVKEYEKEFVKILGFSPDYTEEISPVIGLNAGEKAVAISFITN